MVLREWNVRAGCKTLHIESGAPEENTRAESFKGRLRDEVSNRELFTAPGSESGTTTASRTSRWGVRPRQCSRPSVEKECQ